jgi:predicted O-linked N-acetylglucosamine transferase (SPINDLY family)
VTAYADWLQRGRVHQWEGRPVDAMLCFQRAAALEPAAADPRYLLGEVHWQLGAIPAAVAAWREAARVAPHHPASQLALAEALLALGDADAACDAAAIALRLSPTDGDARVLHAVSAVASGRSEDALVSLEGAFGEDAGRLRGPAAGAALAGALASGRQLPGSRELLRALVPHVATVALALLVPIAQAATRDDSEVALRDARDAIAHAALERPIAEDDLDTLRSLALAFSVDGRGEHGLALARRYAEASRAFLPAGPPLGWPRRPAGRTLRVHALLPGEATAMPAAIGLLRATAVRCEGVEWTLLADARETVRDPGAWAVVRVVPAALDLSVAAAIAREAPDVLLDLAGLALPSGRLLAWRPAPLIAAVPVAGAPHASPLVDATWPTDAVALAERLHEAMHRARAQATATLDAAALARRFDDAVDAHRSRRLDEATEGYRAILDEQPEHAATLHLLGALRAEQGDVYEAASLLARALEAAPSFAEARAAAARLERDRRDPDRGIGIVDAGLERDPRSATLWRVKGELELARHDGVAAEAAFAHALALHPTDAEPHYNLGVAFQKQGRRTDAARAYQRSLAFDAGFVDAHFNLGVLFQESGATEPAIAAYRAVLDRDDARVAAYRNLGEVLLAAGRIDEWLANFRRFESRCPDALPLAVQALEACQYAADFASLERYLDGLRDERFRARDPAELADALEQLLYLLLFFDVEAETIHRFAKTYSETAPSVYGPPLPRRARREPGKLRIGYLSADLRNHVMGKMMWSAIEHHDRNRFALHFYSLSAVRDDWTGRFERIADRFDVVAGLPEREAARRIAADDLDLLVDLSGHTKGGKPGILAHKPARVQLTHVASAGTVGLDTVDFKLTDRHADVPENQATTIETLLPMEGCVYPFRRVEAASAHPFSRTALGLATGDVVIGTFVTPMKLSRRCLGLWRDVLARLPRAKLAFSPTSAALVPVVERIAAAAGIGRERLVFVPQGRDDAEGQARYAVVDFVLDPMPFGGVNGVIEPLCAGVPVVTLLGRRHGERSAYTILANLGVTSTVAQGGREYVDISARLAEDPGFMREVRASIVAGLARSPLVDMRAHTRHLEAAYIAALRERAPESLSDVGG